MYPKKSYRLKGMRPVPPLFPSEPLRDGSGFESSAIGYASNIEDTTESEDHLMPSIMLPEIRPTQNPSRAR